MSTVPGQPYGDASQQALQQQTAPMAGTPPTPPAPDVSATPPGAGPGMPAFAGTPLDAPSQRPGEPVTHGVNIGPGAGTDALQTGPYGGPQSTPGVGPADGSMTRLLTHLSGTDTTGVLADLLQSAAARGA